MKNHLLDCNFKRENSEQFNLRSLLTDFREMKNTTSYSPLIQVNKNNTQKKDLNTIIKTSEF